MASAPALQTVTKRRRPKFPTPFAEWHMGEVLPRQRVMRRVAIEKGWLDPKTRYLPHARPVAVVDGFSANDNGEYGLLTYTEAVVRDAMKSFATREDRQEYITSPSLEELRDKTGYSKGCIRKAIQRMFVKRVMMLYDPITGGPAAAREQVVHGGKSREHYTYKLYRFEDIKAAWHDDPTVVVTDRPGGMLTQVPFCAWTQGRGMFLVKHDTPAALDIPDLDVAPAKPAPSKPPAVVVPIVSKPAEPEPPEPVLDEATIAEHEFLMQLTAKYLRGVDAELEGLVDLLRATAKGMGEAFSNADVDAVFWQVFRNAGSVPQHAKFFRTGCLKQIHIFFKNRKIDAHLQKSREAREKKKLLDVVRAALHGDDEQWQDDVRRMYPDEVAEVMKESRPRDG